MEGGRTETQGLTQEELKENRRRLVRRRERASGPACVVWRAQGGNWAPTRVPRAEKVACDSGYPLAV